MLIGKDYKIETDKLNVTLSKGHISKKGVESWYEIGYFSSIQNALKHLVNLEVQETGLKDIRTVIAKIEELYKLIASITPQLENQGVSLSPTMPLRQR